MSKNARPFGESSACQLLGEWLGRDDVAADRDDPPAQRRHERRRCSRSSRRRRPSRGSRRDRSRRRSGRRPGGGSSRARTPSWRSAPARSAAATSPAKYLPGWSSPLAGDGEPAVVRVAADLLAQPLARHERGLDAERGEGLGRPRQVVGMRRRVGEVEVAALAELAVDRLVGDQPLDERVGVERLAEQRRARSPRRSARSAPRAPLVAGMDDAAVAGRAAEARASRPRARVTAAPRRASSRAAVMPV